MWIVYLKKNRQVVGMSALCEPDLAKEAALAEVVQGLASGGSVHKYDALEVQDATAALALMSVPLQDVKIAESSRGKRRATATAPKMSFLLLRCDASEVHPVDGTPEIKADGLSHTTISVQKLDVSGKPQTSRRDNDELYLRTTAGTLLSLDGKAAARSTRLKNGDASFRLMSEAAPRVATVSVLSKDAALHEGRISIAFV